MMINFVIFLGIVAIGAWLGNVLMVMENQIGQSRSRVRAVKDSVGKLESALRRLQREEEALTKEIETTLAEIVEARKKQTEIQRRLVEAQGKRRPQLLILSDRRNPSDKEWIVTVTNSQIGEIDAMHPLALEWTRGRDYLVWAETEREASERAARRFASRPGYQVKSVATVKDNLYASASAKSAA